MCGEVAGKHALARGEENCLGERRVCVPDLSWTHFCNFLSLGIIIIIMVASMTIRSRSRKIN